MKNEKTTIVEDFYTRTSHIKEAREQVYNTINNLIQCLYNEKFKLNPIDIEIAMGNKEKIEEFIDNGMDINLPNEHGITPLITAIYFKNYEITRLLVENGADVNYIYKENNFSPLIFACNARDERIIELLLKYDADVNIKDSNGYDALHHLISKGFPYGLETYNHLVIPELSWIFANHYGSRVKKEQNLKAIDLLIEYGIDINYVNQLNELSKSVNAISILLEELCGNDDAIKKLIEKGAIKKAYEIDPNYIYGYQELSISDSLIAKPISYMHYLGYINLVKKYDITIHVDEKTKHTFERPKIIKKTGKTY